MTLINTGFYRLPDIHTLPNAPTGAVTLPAVDSQPETVEDALIRAQAICLPFTRAEKKP